MYKVNIGVYNCDEMHLLPEPLFTVPTDNTHMTHIVSTEHGRIFMAGKDGNLYELQYQVCLILFPLSVFVHPFVGSSIKTVKNILNSSLGWFREQQNARLDFFQNANLL